MGVFLIIYYYLFYFFKTGLEKIWRCKL